MKACPVCDTTYPDQHKTCPTDGAVLIETREHEAGHIVRSKYRILRKVGQGGMGIVYLAEHLLMGNQQVALKFLSPELSRNPQFIRKFRVEACIAFLLNHPNIVMVSDLDQDEEGNLFIAMEYVAGPSLRTALREAIEPISAVRALQIGYGVAAGLAAAHARGAVHRDIKPENILLATRPDGEVHPKVLDFGIAAMTTDVTSQSLTQGLLLTPQYAAPEQWRGIRADQLDGRTDLYALGCVLYEMLAGRTPFRADNMEGWMFQHLQGVPEPVDSLRPDLAKESPGLNPIVMRLLAKERAHRFSSATALLQALTSAIETPVDRGRLVANQSGEDETVKADWQGIAAVAERRQPDRDAVSSKASERANKQTDQTNSIGVGRGASTQAILSPGDLILGRFKIGRHLGSGGTGDVYEAFDRELSQTVALKMIRPHIAENELVLSRLRKDLQLARRLSGPNVCRIHELFVDEGTDRLPGRAFLTMEFLDGVALAQKVQAGPLAWPEAEPIAIDICDGLAVIHGAGIIHRDLKSRSIMLSDRDGKRRAVLMDFGLAREFSSPGRQGEPGITLPDTVAGTPEYMAPEQFEDKAVSQATDIYAVGILLYELLTGRHPFASSNFLGAAVLRGKRFSPPSSINHTVPHWLDRVIKKCLEYDPSRRYQSANELARALRSREPRPLPFGGPRSSRWITAITAAVLTGLTVTLWYLHLPLPPPHISEYVPLTHDGHILSVGGTDGSRIYFNSNPWGSIEQVGVSGGEIAKLPITELQVAVSDVSPDGSNLLIESMYPWTLWSVGVVGGSPRFIANHPVGHILTWSPDGKSIAYFDELGRLDVMQSDGTNLHKLLDVKGRITSIAWSPDGNRIRFTQDDALWEVSSLGSNLHRLFPAWQGPQGQCCGRWTPDGDFFVFLAGRNNRIGAIDRSSTPFASARIGAFEQIWVIDERHSLFRQAPREPVQLTSGPIHWDNPFPSKDGRKIFAAGAAPLGELVRFDSKSNEFKPFLGGISAEFVSFSRDGGQVAYVTFPGGVLWRAKLDGSERMQIASPPTYPVGCRWSRWSPDGTTILFAAPRNSSVCALYFVSARGGQPELMAPDENGVSQGSGDWSPDGRRIVYHVLGPVVCLHIFDLERHEATKIPGSDGLYSPRWSPDGRYIAALTKDYLMVKLFDVRTGQWSTLVQNTNVEWSFPSWSRDSKFLSLLGGVFGGRALFRVAVSGGKPARVVDLTGFSPTGFFGRWFGLDPKDEPILLRDKGTNDIYALTLESN